MDKRAFIKSISAATIGITPFYRDLQSYISTYADHNAHELAQNEDFWEKVRGDYRLKDDYINLENGYYCFIPQPILDQYQSLFKKYKEVDKKINQLQKTFNSNLSKTNDSQHFFF